jgi:tetratricopeptide (TPR) repeat protein
MKRILLTNVIFLLIVLAGCNTTYHYTEFIKPSNRYVPSTMYVLGIAQRSTTPKSICPVYTNGIPYGELEKIPNKSAKLAIENLKKLCADIGRFEFVEIEIADSTVNEKEFANRPFTQEEIESISKEYDLDGIISLDGHNMLIRTSGSVSVVSVTDGSGMPSQVPEFSKESEVSMSLLWRFYDSSTGQMIDEYQENYERVFGRVSYSEEEIQEFKDEDMGLMDVSGMAAYDYFERISPHWEPDYRQYFNLGSPELVEIATKLDRMGDWEQAAKSWKELTDSEDSNVSHKACFNMALASEIIGQPRVAIEWINRAKLINPTKRTLKYAELLERQILIYEVVNSQLGIE